MNEIATIISDVRTDGELINLTDLWRAVDSPPYKTTTFWLRQDITKEFISAFLKKFKYDPESYLKIKKGRIGGGTWAHKQIALEYAKYLDPKLAVVVNQIFFERIEEEKNPDKIAERYIKTYQKQGKSENWINERFKGISVRNNFTKTLAAHKVEHEGFRNCTNAIYSPLFGGSTKVVRVKKGLDKKQNIRDNLSAVELASVGLAELLALENIEKNNVTGSGKCEIVCLNSSRAVASAIIQARKSISSPSTF